MGGVALALGLVVYNNAMNLWPRFHGSLYLPANLALTAASLGIALGEWSLDRRALGLGPGQDRGLLLGLALGVVAAAPLFLALRSRKGAAAVADHRIPGMSRTDLLYRVLVRVPFGTALPEEVLFRGVLYAALVSSGGPGVAGSSVAFGLWHIAPTWNLLRENGLAGRSKWVLAGMLFAGVLVTAVAGMILIRLRLTTGGIAAPFGLHAALNGLGTVAAHLAGRRVL